MKQEYTQYNFLSQKYKKEVNKKTDLMKNTSLEDFCSYLLKETFDTNADYNIKTPLSDEDIEKCENILLLSEFLFLKKKCSQYFLPDKKLIDFLVNSVREYDCELCSILPDAGIVNFPVKCNIPPIIFSKIKATFDDGTQGEALHVFQKRGLTSGYGIDYLCVPIIKKSQLAITVTETLINQSRIMANIIMGLCLYIKCFPFSVHDGLPEGCRHPGYYNFSNCKSVSIAPEILESDNRSVTPHIRSGHFRLLQDERYKNKRFQVIFVRECFVKGTAKTVEDINERKLINE